MCAYVGGEPRIYSVHMQRMDHLTLTCIIIIYRIAGCFHGVPIFIIFVVCLQVTKFPPTDFSTHVIGAI